MKFRTIFLALAAIIALAACSKGSGVSNIPEISLMAFVPLDSMIVNVDTTEMEFSLVDGDGDIGYSDPTAPADTISEIYLKDSRYDTGFSRTPFPAIDVTIEDPKKGLQGTCIFIPLPQPVPRPDSLHTATGDTLTYEVYIRDRAGHSSNHITTPQLIIRP